MKRTKKAVVFLGIRLAIAVLALAARNTPQPVEKQPEAYGMFEWEEAAVEDPEAAAELAGRLGVTRWYQELPEEIDPDATERFVKALAQKGVAVYALVGATEWGFEEDGASLTGALEAVAEYNLQVSGEGRIAGVMEDVEPYVRTRWKEAPEESAKLYLSGMKKAYRYARKRGLVSIACIPRHYDDQGLTEMLRGLIAEACDEVAVMDYDCGNEAAAISTEAALAAEYGKPLHCILEFQKVGKHGLTEDKTYYNKGLAAARAAWEEVQRSLPEQQVIRDYHWSEPVRELLEREENEDGP